MFAKKTFCFTLSTFDASGCCQLLVSPNTSLSLRVFRRARERYCASKQCWCTSQCSFVMWLHTSSTYLDGVFNSYIFSQILIVPGQVFNLLLTSLIFGSWRFVLDRGAETLFCFEQNWLAIAENLCCGAVECRISFLTGEFCSRVNTSACFFSYYTKSPACSKRSRQL